jgi:phospholipid N-methyltransferase
MINSLFPLLARLVPAVRSFLMGSRDALRPGFGVAFAASCRDGKGDFGTQRRRAGPETSWRGRKTWGRRTGDLWSFLKAWAGDPGRVGAIAPSGEALARLITREIRGDHGPVLELGPGTGVFTSALLARGLAARDLTLVERGGEFAQLLRRRFPGVRVLEMDATRLDPLDGERFAAVVSGLPLLAMSRRQVFSLLSGAFEILEAGGAFYQFTYGPRCPVPAAILKRLGLSAACVGRVYRNLPPAAVYRIMRV